jgi:hypothetical protein
MAEPPKPHPTQRGDGAATNLGDAWVTANKFDPNQVPGSWGNVDCRYFNRATTGMFDGHAETQTLEQLRDMQKWSNYARAVNGTSAADWNFEPGP